MVEISLMRITSLALADAVNPCALAVLAMVLITIMTQNPEKRQRVLYAGLAFTTAVFIGYFLYGLIIIQFFKTIDSAIKSSSFPYYLYNGLAVFAMILGALNIKDYFMYKPGSFATEMPLSLRPRAKMFIKKMMSPKGAFFIGIFVTLFLLPCTIGPLIIASGELSKLSFIQVFYWLLYYNILFVLPMIGITIAVYVGYTTVEDVSGWKERNIKRLHLAAGILLFLVGLSLLMGWI